MRPLGARSVPVVVKQRLKSPRARLFVALDLPQPVLRAIVAWQAEALDDPPLRAVASDALHVTLCFLGYRRELEIERIGELVTAAGARPVSIGLDAAPVPLPPRRPRLFALGARSEAAVQLQSEISRALEGERLYHPERRPFWPHVTVARVRPERGSRSPAGGRRGRPRRVERPPRPLPEGLLEPFGAVRATLYRSTLRPSGAEYAPLASMDLPPG